MTVRYWLMVALVALIGCAPTLSNAATVSCAGVDDTATIQSAIAAGGIVELTGGTCRATGILTMATVNTTVVIDAPVVSTASPVFRLTAQNVGIIGKARRLPIVGPGIGISIEGSISIYLDLFQLNTGGTGIAAVSGAGLWASRIHMNGTAGANSSAMRFTQWDTAYLSHILSEEHDTGVRLGYGNGNVNNIQMTNIILDRLHATYGQALRVEANPGYQVGNVQSVSLWASQGYYPVTLIASQGGMICNIQLENSYYTGFTVHAPVFYGNVCNVQDGKALYL